MIEGFDQGVEAGEDVVGGGAGQEGLEFFQEGGDLGVLLVQAVDGVGQVGVAGEQGREEALPTPWCGGSAGLGRASGS